MIQCIYWPNATYFFKGVDTDSGGPCVCHRTEDWFGSGVAFQWSYLASIMRVASEGFRLALIALDGQAKRVLEATLFHAMRLVGPRVWCEAADD